MTDHDQRWKTLLREFLDEFFRLFFPEWADLLDFSQVEWLDKEVFPDPPEGRRRALDLPARLPLTPAGRAAKGLTDAVVALIHIEVESADSATSIDDRMPRYYFHLREAHDAPVLPVVLFLQLGLEGVGIRDCTENFGPLEILRFRYRYAGLPALDGVQYLQSGSGLGIAMSALMRVPADRRPWFKAEALQRLAQSAYNQHRKYLLAECVDKYLPLVVSEQEQFDRLLEEDYQEAKTMTAPTIYEEGMRAGEIKTLHDVVIFQLEQKFEDLPEAARQRIREMTADEMRNIAKQILKASSLADLGLES